MLELLAAARIVAVGRNLAALVDICPSLAPEERKACRKQRNSLHTPKHALLRMPTTMEPEKWKAAGAANRSL